MLSKRSESTEVDRRTWLHMPLGTPWSTSSDTHKFLFCIEKSDVLQTLFVTGYHALFVHIIVLLKYIGNVIIFYSI